MSLRSWLMVLVVLSISGCQGGGAEPSRVTGTVTYDGSPLTRGSLRAVSESGTAVTGKIGADGRFELGSRTGKGVPPGSYKVAVLVFEMGTADHPEEERQSLVPQHYTEPELSGLTFQVAGRAPVEIELELTGSRGGP